MLCEAREEACRQLGQLGSRALDSLYLVVDSASIAELLLRHSKSGSNRTIWIQPSINLSLDPWAEVEPAGGWLSLDDADCQ